MAQSGFSMGISPEGIGIGKTPRMHGTNKYIDAQEAQALCKPYEHSAQ